MAFDHRQRGTPAGSPQRAGERSIEAAGDRPGFADRLDQALERVRTPALVGLDPHLELLPEPFAEARINTAFQLAQGNQLGAAAQDLDAFLALIVYADTYARKELASKNKDRNHCLKRIEQAVFKQSRNLESITRELPLESREAVESQVDEVKKIRLRAINDLLGRGQVINSSN